MTRYAIVGTGARAQMFARSLHAYGELVALADINPARVAAQQRRLLADGAPRAAEYHPDQLDVMLAKERVDTLIVCTVDATHDAFIVGGLEAGCAVVTEKPMTTDAAKCRRILDAARRTGGDVTVAFNYRFHPVHEQVRELLASGAIGEVSSVHFEWLLDVRHGADYFRRWHRDKASSGGLLVHKATHHFDLVNWWLGSTPERVTAEGRLFFYGDSGARHGFARDYARAHGAPDAVGDPFALHLKDNPALAELYLDAEEHDGYHRDVNVFAPGVTIEDDMAVLARYASGATMSYHLTAFAPWEGYRVAVNGSLGRLELDVVESDHVAPGVAGAVKGHTAALHGVEAAAESGGVSLRLRRFWQQPTEVVVPAYDREGHGGADIRMTGVLFGGHADPLARSATVLDGARSLLTGLAANESIATGRMVPVRELLDLAEWER
ncbi:putative dehydrogenase [Allocatelliglobosispora scoriae]|uniref:Putative dehydrogenase n=1 Tax=Allocatelliglobosispora scoriae TaxID=643052 RepID=A0A841BSD4_9ACTN|nr:Gfo/Idh/MocA family oxidoreductase [Allocatelliglobosispora scoriae]MBB5870306.1 putative dehydrogenase [Allocatelliglobosispora scoriae]